MRPTRRSLRDRQRGVTIKIKTMIRRVVLSSTAGALWGIQGYEDEEGNVEVDEVEAFSGVGFLSRPKIAARAEAIMVKVGGQSGHPIIVATRDQDAVKILGDLAADETAIFTSKTVVKITAAGEVLIGSHGGAFHQLVTKADFENHNHLSNGAAAPTEIMPSVPPGFKYTTKLRAE